MKNSLKFAGVAVALAASALAIVPAQAAETARLETVVLNTPCVGLDVYARANKLAYFSDVYNHYYKQLKDINQEGVDNNASALNIADRYLKCEVVKADFASSTEGSGKVFGSSFASLSS